MFSLWNGCYEDHAADNPEGTSCYYTVDSIFGRNSEWAPYFAGPFGFVSSGLSANFCHCQKKMAVKHSIVRQKCAKENFPRSKIALKVRKRPEILKISGLLLTFRVVFEQGKFALAHFLRTLEHLTQGWQLFLTAIFFVSGKN